MATMQELVRALPYGECLSQNPMRGAALLTIGIFAVWRVLSTARQYQRLRNFKGPPMAAVTKLWLLRNAGGTSSNLNFYEVTRKYGKRPLARIGPNDLLNDDPELMRLMLGVRSGYRRSNWYDAMRFHPLKNNVISWRDENEHGRMRSMMAAGYSGREVGNLEGKVDDNILRLFRLLGEYIDAGKPVDFARKVQYFTLDVISDLAFGERLGFMDTDSDVHEYIQTTEETMPYFVALTVFPELMKMFGSPLLSSMLPSEKDSKGFGKIIGIAKKLSAERFGQDKKVQRDMLGSFISHGMSQEEAESEILVQIVAGSDTTATSIRATVLHVITTPRIYNRLLAEIVAHAPGTSRPIISDAEARGLPYLQAVIKEGLRIFPPGGDVWKGRFIPEGTRIGWSTWAMFRREETWGPDGEEFRPERWLLGEDGGTCESAEKLREMETTVDLLFSHGRSLCLGKPVALMELNKVFFELFRRFDLSVCYPAQPWKSINFGMHVQTDFWIRGTRRE